MFGSSRDGWSKAPPAPSLCLLFAEVAGSCLGLSNAVMGTGQVAGYDEVDVGGAMATTREEGAPLREVLDEDARKEGASLGAALRLAPFLDGESRVEEQLDKALTRAEKSVEKGIEADADEFKRELDQAEKQAAAS